MQAARSEFESEATQAYCREARRLRHRLAHAPVRLHRSLRNLRPVTALALPLSADDQFAESVVRSIEAGTLRYSRRQTLLREADRLGIERFEANLIIALVQHRLGRADRTSTAESESSFKPWMVVLAVQVAIVLTVAAGWLTLR